MSNPKTQTTSVSDLNDIEPDSLKVIRTIVDTFCEAHGDSLIDDINKMAVDIARLSSIKPDASEFRALATVIAEQSVIGGWYSSGDRSDADEANPLRWFLEKHQETISAELKRYLIALVDSPLRVFQVSAAKPGKAVTFIDLLEEKGRLVTATKGRSVESLRPGMIVATRAVNMGSHYRTSYSLLNIDPARLSQVLSIVSGIADEFDGDVRDVPMDDVISTALIAAWFHQFNVVPSFVDSATGQPIVLITDSYEVRDWRALTVALANQRDVVQDAPNAWRRMASTERCSASINPGDRNNRIEVFYRCEQDAHIGKQWLESVAGESISHLVRRSETAEEAFSEAIRDPEAFKNRASQKPEIEPEAMTALSAHMYRKHYADWENTAIPLLGNKSPKEACKSTIGKSRVKALLSMYEENEKRLAQQDGREAVSLQFLWDKVSLKRDY